MSDRKAAAGGDRWSSGAAGSIRLVSVVIPCHDGARFLAEAIESALAQTYQEIEVVVVDDGSTDDSARIAAAFPEVVLVQQVNRGVAAARNAGLSRSRGSYVVFLDADDRLVPDAVERGVELLSLDASCAFVAGEHVRIDEEGHALPGPEPPPPGEDVYERLLRRNFISVPGCVVYRRDALPADPFDPAVAPAEDYDLYLRLARTGEVRAVSGVSVEYRVHAASVTSSRPERMLSRTVTVLRRQQQFTNGNPRYRRAYADGMRFWRVCYGRQTARAIVEDLRTRELRRASSRLLMLLRYWPGVVVYAPGELLRLAARRGSGSQPRVDPPLE